MTKAITITTTTAFSSTKTAPQAITKDFSTITTVDSNNNQPIIKSIGYRSSRWNLSIIITFVIAILYF